MESLSRARWAFAMHVQRKFLLFLGTRRAVDVVFEHAKGCKRFFLDIMRECGYHNVQNTSKLAPNSFYVAWIGH